MKAQGESQNAFLWRWSRKEVRYGQLELIMVSLILIIASVFALAAFTLRMEQVVVKQGKDSLTADIVYHSAHPLADSLLEQVDEAGLVSSIMIRFATMALTDEQMQLVSVKAVDTLYPLQGKLRLMAGEGRLRQQVQPNELWLAESLFSQLEVEIGDSLDLGDASLVITGRILEEPGVSFNPFEQMPTVLIHRQDVPKTGAIQPGSRVEYRLFLKGAEQEITRLKQNHPMMAGDRWIDKDSQSQTSELFYRAQHYLSLTVMVVVLIASASLVLTSQHYVRSRRQSVLMLKSLGATSRWLWLWLARQISYLFILAVVIGSLVGAGLERALRFTLTDMLPDPLPSYGWMPFVLSLAVCILLMLPALGIPLRKLVHLTHGSQTSVVMRLTTADWGLLLLPAIGCVFWYWHYPVLGLMLLGMVAVFTLLGVCCWGLLHLLSRYPLSIAFRLALSRLKRTPILSGLQLASVAFSFMLLSSIVLIRYDLLADWQRLMPSDAPNTFAFNLSEAEKEAYLSALDAQVIVRSQAYPMIRGRLTQINGQDALTLAQGGESQRALSRELNLSWGAELPEYNTLVAGQWQGKRGVSVEQKLAQELGIQLGDTLRFMINTQPIDVVVNTIREVDWRSMKPNFYFILTEDVLAAEQGNWLVSLLVSEEQRPEFNLLSKSHPTVSVINIDNIVRQLQQILQQITTAIGLLTALSVVAGTALIATLFRLSLASRQQEIRLYRTLGASQRRIMHTLWAEYGVIALIAGIVAALCAEGIVALLMHFVFSISPSYHPWLWLALPCFAFLLLSLVLMYLWKSLTHPLTRGWSES